MLPFMDGHDISRERLSLQAIGVLHDRTHARVNGLGA